MHNKQDDGNNKQDVNQAANDMKNQSQSPKYEQNKNNCPEHDMPPCMLRLFPFSFPTWKKFIIISNKKSI